MHEQHDAGCLMRCEGPCVTACSKCGQRRAFIAMMFGMVTVALLASPMIMTPLPIIDTVTFWPISIVGSIWPFMRLVDCAPPHMLSTLPHMLGMFSIAMQCRSQYPSHKACRACSMRCSHACKTNMPSLL